MLCIVVVLGVSMTVVLTISRFFNTVTRFERRAKPGGRHDMWVDERYDPETGRRTDGRWMACPGCAGCAK